MAEATMASSSLFKPAHNHLVWGSNLSPGLSVWSLHVLPVHVWVFSRKSGFLSWSKDMLVRWVDQFKLTIGVSDTEYLSSSVSPVIGWWPTQGGPRLSPPDKWDKLQQTHVTWKLQSRNGKWMDIYYIFIFVTHHCHFWHFWWFLLKTDGVVLEGWAVAVVVAIFFLLTWVQTSGETTSLGGVSWKSLF